MSEKISLDSSESDILNIGRLQLYSVWEQFHARIS